ncbi:hypothetical protein [Legionella sp. km772]|uniref:hypothetical protein n=1 Tax=Legionella sp. km772 TaxID=2498111 RepID=UPI000F8DB15E|nr:hypothetical protein [Legionella sp. km772]RUR05419.1 hypothetical protein ELY15_14340 [Legionella sp. km772]
MIKRIFVAVLFLLNSTIVLALGDPSTCPKALPTNNAGFCASFKVAAVCHCTTSGLPAGMCQDMNALYNRMIGLFGSVQKACQYQKDTTTQNCIDSWSCYRSGGKDSQGRLCSSTGNSCK